MIVFTAEKSDGDIYVVAGRAGLGRESFAEFVIEYLRTLPDDEATPAQLDLYEWRDERAAGVWMVGSGANLEPGQAWPSVIRNANFGEVRLEYLGDGESDYRFREYAPSI